MRDHSTQLPSSPTSVSHKTQKTQPLRKNASPTFSSAIALIAGAFATAMGNVEARDANKKDGKVIDGICVPGVGALYPDGICQFPPSQTLPQGGIMP